MRLTDTRSLSLSRHGKPWWGFDDDFEEASETDVLGRHVPPFCHDTRAKKFRIIHRTHPQHRRIWVWNCSIKLKSPWRQALRETDFLRKHML